jgi:PTH1 family peptidyl-tRNA hydrolase
MKVILGLGNPGEKYQNTRHNIGFLTLDELIRKLEPLSKTFWEEEKNLKAQIKKIGTGDSSLLLAKPTTFMNLSGFAVSKILNYYKIPPENLIVIHDDIDLPFGKIRIRFGGGAGGHHGVESIIEQVRSDKFLRIRLGIGNPRKAEGKQLKRSGHKDVERHVLGSVGSDERGKVKTMTKKAVRDLELILKHGIEKYMSRYNK